MRTLESVSYHVPLTILLVDVFFFQKCRHVKAPQKLKSNPELVQREGWPREESLWRSLCSGHQEPFHFDFV